jgi:hypothetical protein
MPKVIIIADQNSPLQPKEQWKKVYHGKNPIASFDSDRRRLTSVEMANLQKEVEDSAPLWADFAEM